MRADARASRRAIVDAARTLFAAHGVHVSLSTIAAEAGVGIATLYRHFPTRDDLLVALASEFGAYVIAFAEEAESAFPADPEAAWRDFVHAVAGLRFGALLFEVASLREAHELAQRLESVRTATLQAVAGVLDNARSAGLVRPGISPLQFHLGLAVLTRPLPALIDAFAPGETDWLVEVYLAGLARDAGPRPARRG